MIRNVVLAYHLKIFMVTQNYFAQNGTSSSKLPRAIRRQSVLVHTENFPRRIILLYNGGGNNQELGEERSGDRGTCKILDNTSYMY